MDELFVGEIAGIPLEMEMVDDSFESAIAKYDYPFVDGVDLEDMGQRGRMIRVRAYFWDEDGHYTYENHAALINLPADHVNLLDFQHPKYGLIKGKIERINVRHNDLKRTADVDIDFVEKMRGTAEPVAVVSVLGSVEEAYTLGQEEQIGALLEDMMAELPVSDSEALTQILEAGAGLYASVLGFSTGCREMVRTFEDAIQRGEEIVAAVTAPVDSLQATLAYVESIPGRVIGSIAGTVEKTARLCDTLRYSPARVIESLGLAFDDLEDSFAEFSDEDPVFQRHVQIQCAQRMALEVAQIYEEDQAAFVESSQTSNALIAAAASTYEVMTLPELEASLALVRTRLDAAVESAREMESLKTMAASLLEYVNFIRLEREKMQAVRLDNALPLHLVCLKYGLPYTDAERLLKVNRNIRNPNFTSGEVLVYVR